MNRRLQLILIISLLLSNASDLGCAPNLYMLSLFHNESITSSFAYGGRVTLGFGNEELYSTASVRFQYPETSLTFHTTKRAHGGDSLLSGHAFANLAYFSHAQDNGYASLTAAYALSANTPFPCWSTRLQVSLGAHAITSWSRSYDKALYSIAPHLSVSLSQALFDRLYVKLFITTDTLCLPESNFSYYYGLCLALEVTENLIFQVRPLVRLSDYTYESLFVTLRELSVSVVWTDASNRKHALEELGVWL